MNSQWMTTMLSDVQTKLRKSLEDRGIRLSPSDIAALIEEISPAASRSLLGVAMDFIRPFNLGMGFRVAQLTDTQVELVIPARVRNQDGNHQLHEGAIVAAGIEAIELLWDRHAPMGGIRSQIQSFEFRKLKDCSGEARLKMELPESTRESALSSMRQFSEAQSELTAYVYSDQMHAVSEIRFKLKLQNKPGLTHSGETN